MYTAPRVLRKRKQNVGGDGEVTERVVEVNEEAIGMELHKDAKFFANWEKVRKKCLN